ncbi:acyl-CoA carboxylase epsilon subunit [Streptomyces sp.]|uniref:acyl-CoA carboxylase epsilon subunit n=1 Tax=Streptomyces sp. TaxID=1931 RepID=UPI002F40E016
MTHGSPTDEEVAAVVVALTASVSAMLVAPAGGRAGPPARWWSRRALHLTEHITERGPGAWLISRVR